jgi:membrane-associated protease RseP (regulator of RpoE activity)
MKFPSALYIAGTALVLLAGCASRKGVHARGWVGGELVRAEPPSWKVASENAHVIDAFPAKLQPEYKTGLVVNRLTDASPLAKAGLQESDLIVAFNGERVEKVPSFEKAVDAITPGVPIKLLVYRDGELAEKTAVVGKETYRYSGTFMFGLGFSTHLDFDWLPDPDFSLVALGFKRKQDRLQLDTARQNYIQSTRTEETPTKGVSSPEGWRAWLGPFSVSDYKTILAQETVEASQSLQRP